MKFLGRHRNYRRILIGYAAFDALYWWKVKPRLRTALGMERA